MRIFAMLFLGLSVFQIFPAQAVELIPTRAPTQERLLLHLNGFSFHFSSDRDELNELNYGLGFSYLLGTLDSETPFLDDFKVYAEADIYKDSFSELGYLFGASFQRPLCRNLDWGMSVGLIHEDNLQDKSGAYLFPYVFPFIQTHFNSRVNGRLLFIPPVHNEGILAFQLIIKL